MILFDETIRQQSDDGTPFPELLAAKGVVPGIKVDIGAKPLAAAAGETVTEGLDGLRERLAEYYELGARFAKWRATLSVGDGLPSRYCVRVNAQALARYAALCQEAGIVPIVEPEVLMDTDHSIDACYEATAQDPAGCLRRARRAAGRSPGDAAEAEHGHSRQGQRRPGRPRADRRCDGRLLPPPRACDRPGIVFLSGGQSEVEATATWTRSTGSSGGPGRSRSRTAAHSRRRRSGMAWRGGERGPAQAAFLHRARCNAAAAGGRYDAELEAREPDRLCCRFCP